MARKTAEEKAAEAAAIAGQGAGVERQTPAQAAAPKGMDWAVNRAKLARAVTHVKATQKGLAGKEFEDAVKERYVELGGLMGTLKGMQGGKSAASTTNMAPNDESGEGDDE